MSRSQLELTLLMFVLLLVPSTGWADNYVTHIERGDQFYRQFDNDEALREYEAAYAENPDDYIVLARMIRIYNDQGRIRMGGLR